MLDRLYRVLLYACPASFREEYGDEMVRLARDRYQREGFLSVTAALIPDLVAIAWREHMDTLRQDVVYAFRTFAKNPGYALVAFVTLALVIGANTTIFSVVNAVVFQPLPYRDPDRLVQLWEKRPQQGRVRNVVSVPDFEDWSKQNTVFEGLSGSVGSAFTIEGLEGAELIRGASISPNTFRILGITPKLGRDFLTGEDQAGREKVVLLNHGLWLRRFGGDPRIVGTSVLMSGEPYTVVGVLPDLPDLPRIWGEQAEIWSPLVLSSVSNGRSAHTLNVFGRLKPGVKLEHARAEMNTIAARLEQQYPNENAGHGVNVFALHDEIVNDNGGNVRAAMLVLLAATGLVLLIACANIANLSLVRASQRRREISIRTALGAGGRRVIRQLLTESLVLSVAGGLAGLGLAYGAVSLLAAANPGNIPRMTTVHIDWRVLLFTLGISLGAGVVFGLAPSLFAARTRVNETLASRGSTDQLAPSRFRRILIVVEVALALLLSIGASLMMQSFVRLARVNPGFDGTNVLTVSLGLLGKNWVDEQRRTAFFREFLDRVRRLPEVASAGATTALPLTGLDQGYSFAIKGRPPVRRADMPGGRYRVVSPGYFEAMRIPLRAGRLILESDTETAPPVVVISETMVRRYWPDSNPLGSFISMNDKWHEVVGVVGDVKYEAPDKEPRPEFYFPYPQPRVNAMSVVLRTSSAPANLAGAVRAELTQIDKSVPIIRMDSFEALLSRSVAQPRLYSTILAAFSAVALLLAAVGIYGTMSFSVGQRTHEIGVRMALGASGGAVQGMVMRHGLLLTLAGVALGIGGAFALTRAMRDLLFGVTSTDPWTFAGAAVLLLAVAASACYFPARRATRVDPLVALRCE
jgi:putative ABC transport system permease protein